MKILLSGMTRMQTNRPSRRTYNTSINALYQALTQAKHKVDWRPLEFNEKKLDRKYDLLIIGLGTISEFSCTYLYETLLATQYDNVLYLVNDWKANATIKLLQNGELFREFVLRNNTGKKFDSKFIAKYEREIEKCRNQMFRQKDNLLGPFFPWGDRNIILEGTPFSSLYEFNPTSFYMKHWTHIQLPKKKKRQWIYGALSDYSKWHTRLQTQWPVQAFNKKTFIPEEDLVDLYAKSYGILMPKYKASGSGWWRARYCHGVTCENVMYAEETEWGNLAEQMHLPIGSIEDMTDRQLNQFAQFQADKIIELTPKWFQVVNHVNEIVEGWAP